MIISLIAAHTKNKVIGLNGKMPWHLSEDLKYFKSITLGKPIIMGRKTFESLGCKPLPGRKNIILSKTAEASSDPNVCWVPSVDKAIELCQNIPEVMVIGGAQIYQQFLPKAKRFYLSLLDKEYEGDTFFPDYEQFDWSKVSEEKKQGFTAIILEKE